MLAQKGGVLSSPRPVGSPKPVGGGMRCSWAEAADAALLEITLLHARRQREKLLSRALSAQPLRAHCQHGAGGRGGCLTDPSPPQHRDPQHPGDEPAAMGGGPTGRRGPGSGVVCRAPEGGACMVPRWHTPAPSPCPWQSPLSPAAALQLALHTMQVTARTKTGTPGWRLCPPPSSLATSPAGSTRRSARRVLAAEGRGHPRGACCGTGQVAPAGSLAPSRRAAVPHGVTRSPPGPGSGLRVPVPSGSPGLGRSSLRVPRVPRYLGGEMGGDGGDLPRPFCACLPQWDDVDGG